MESNREWIGTARALITDDRGNILRGIENGITPEMLLTKLGYTRESTDPLEWYKKYNQARVTLNFMTQEFNKIGEVAGGMSRNPIYYFVARRGNKREQGYILKNKIRYTTGRLKTIQRVGESIMDTKKIGTAIKLLDATQKQLESEDQPQLAM